MRFPFYKQPNIMDCGPTCLKMVAQYHGKRFSLDMIRELARTSVEGTDLAGLSGAAESLGFRTLAVSITFEQALNQAPLPFIAHWNQNHFVVVYKMTKKRISLADPAFGLTTVSKEEFIKNWINTSNPKHEGIALLLEPTTIFYSDNGVREPEFDGISYLLKSLSRYSDLFIQLGVALAAASIIQLIIPFLTQSIVDTGITNKDIDFIYLILAAQFFLFLGKTGIDFVRAWIPLHISTRMSISMVSEFLMKLMKLQIGFFNGKMTGDLMQRISDHTSLERLMSSSVFDALFAIMNLIVFSIAIAVYDWSILFVFGFGTMLYVGWTLLFLQRRRKLNFNQFSEMSKNQSKLFELITGMQEIKLHNAERQKRWEWEKIQSNLFRVTAKRMATDQFQSIGSSFINESKNIIITVLSAKLVMDGEITLGMMLSVSYMIGQINGPITTLLAFTHAWQDAQISLERLGEIHSKPNEEKDDSATIKDVPLDQAISLSNISFKYPGTDYLILDKVNLVIPPGKMTAIVGASGCGKTSLLKLLLKFYEPSSGEIRVGPYSLTQIAHSDWRSSSGSVMQDGFIFNDTIARNIAIGQDSVDMSRVNHALKMASLYDFVMSLPHSINTKIGSEGVGISAGQRQRILIARAIYKNPNLVLFDEATSALDAITERIVVSNLNRFLAGRTSIVIAHRLSTIKDADQIVVLGAGRVIEIGNHEELVSAKGAYYELIKEQLQIDASSTLINDRK